MKAKNEAESEKQVNEEIRQDGVEKAAELTLLQKQAEIAKETDKCFKEDKNRVFSLRMKAAMNEMIKHAKKLDFERQKKQFEFQQILEKTKIYQATAVQIKQLETTRPMVVPLAHEKRYITGT